MARGSAATRSNKTERDRQDGESVLGRGSRVRGHVKGEGDLRVLGDLEGDVQITGDLAIEDGASITGDIGARGVTIRGGLTGDVSASGAVAILAGAKVTGNMGGAEVSLDEGAAFSGRIEAEFELPQELLSRHGR